MTSMRNAGGSWSRAGWICPLLLAVVLAGCGGDDGSGVERDKALSELSDEEFTELCEWSFGLISEADGIRYGCYLAALLVSEGDAEQCQDLADRCIEEAGEEAAEEGTDTPEAICEDAVGFRPCAAEITVGQLESCSEASADQAHDVAQEISCDGAAEDFTDLETPEPCVMIEEACPDIFDVDPEVTARRLSRLAAARRLAGGL